MPATPQVAAFKKAQKNVEQMRRKVAQVEAKQVGTGTFLFLQLHSSSYPAVHILRTFLLHLQSQTTDEKALKAAKQLQGMEADCADLQRAMEEKLLEVQKEKHATLRSGYLSLYHAQSELWSVSSKACEMLAMLFPLTVSYHLMRAHLQPVKRLRDLVGIQERFLDVVNNFPAVTGRNEEGQFLLGSWPEGNEQPPTWYKGDEVGWVPLERAKRVIGLALVPLIHHPLFSFLFCLFNKDLPAANDNQI